MLTQGRIMDIKDCEKPDVSREAKVKSRILELPDSYVKDKQILVIGDVHGCYNELLNLLQDKCQVFKNNNPTQGLKKDVLVIFVGDLINKGPYSNEVLDLVSRTDGMFSVVGNHEEQYPYSVSQRHLNYLKSLPVIISIPYHNALIVHAGLMPRVLLKDQTIDTVINMRNILIGNDITKVTGNDVISRTENEITSMTSYKDVDAGVPWASLWQGPQHVYYGHDARRGKDALGNPTVLRFPWATGLDTRCVKGGELTAVVLPVENEEFYSVTASMNYSKLYKKVNKARKEAFWENNTFYSKEWIKKKLDHGT